MTQCGSHYQIEEAINMVTCIKKLAKVRKEKLTIILEYPKAKLGDGAMQAYTLGRRGYFVGSNSKSFKD